MKLGIGKSWISGKHKSFLFQQSSLERVKMGYESNMDKLRTKVTVVIINIFSTLRFLTVH